MPTLEEVRRELDKDELDYPALASKLGKEVLPELKALVIEDEPRIASKAAYLAGLISGEEAAHVVELASHSRHDIVRVSAAAAITTLPPNLTREIAERLLEDPDIGVRARALKSAARVGHPALSERVRRMAHEDPEASVRELAKELAGKLPPG